MDTVFSAASEQASRMMGGALPASSASFHLQLTWATDIAELAAIYSDVLVFTNEGVYTAQL